MLNKNNTIGIIALSGECDRDKVEASKAFFESLGYKVKLSKNIFDQNRYLAGNDEDKISELHNFFKDSEINLILCARGGYGAIRLVNKIDYDLIKANPKPFCGFSDVTALLLMIYKKTGLVTYHSPMACTDFSTSPRERMSEGQERVGNFTVANFFNTINGEKPTYKAEKVYKEGSAKGILWGGNLSTVVSLCGLDFIPDEDFIFFTEDINEPVYKIDKMLHQLFNIEKFKKNCKGMVLGEFTGIDNNEWLEELLKEIAEGMGMPIISGLKISHNKDKITVPIGIQAEINNLTLCTY